MQASKPLSSRQQGTEAETLAAAWLAQHGLRLVVRNWHCRHGELDIVMEDGATVVFVEVRLRQWRSHGGALESVTAAKQQRLAHTAELFLAAYPALAGRPCRFDVVAMQTTGDNARFDWIRNAFYGDQ